ncbi:hypothetical protein SAMN05443665_102175 [Actinomadura meyerae]|uniref:DUF4352 domain-containing protein n=1 Tax=Actinomadura meyerae TaxID=240840 RepID=A0A239L9J5_9ACTN|nr:hypothetical protein [Actinomadura meyerae]SNT26523.1 hypothetical protein SAMN05443665_102175 [Actinomadura meyerae]
MNVRQVLLRGGAAIGGTLLLAAAMWLHSVRPEVRAAELDPIRTGGKAGEKVETRDFTVRVDGVDAARSLEQGVSLGGAPPVGTDGVYLIVRLSATAAREPLQLRTAELETPGGYTFRQDPRSSAVSAGQPTYEPMIWSSAKLVFELPKERVAGAHLVVGTGGLLPQLSSAADIDLGLSEEKAARLVGAATDRYQVRTP